MSNSPEAPSSGEGNDATSRSTPAGFPVRPWLQLTSCIGLFALVYATLPLWWSGSGRMFPRLPAFSSLVPWAEKADHIVVLALACSTFLAACMAVSRLRSSDTSRTPTMERSVWALVFVFGASVAVFDQFRWQPWFYQFCLTALVFSLASARAGVRLLQVLTVSIYVYSAAGKLDFQFVHTVGQDFLGVILSWCGSKRSDFAEADLVRLAFAFPVAELVLAGLLAASMAGWPTRRLACFLAVVFHLGLAVVFSPLGLDHSLGVIIWNIQFAVQTPLLFSVSARTEHTGEPQRPGWFEVAGGRLAQLTIVLACLLPMVERFGLWDHWTSWALYSPHSSRAEVFVATSSVDKLPSPLPDLIRDAVPAREPGEQVDFEAIWTQVPVERWALQVNGAPLLPQARSGVTLARFFHDQLDSEYKVQVRVQGISGRFDGQRERARAMNLQELKRLSKQFWLNTEPVILDLERPN